VLQSVWETVYVCDLHHPLNTIKKMVLVLPRNTEYEEGFLHYLQKIMILANQISTRLAIYCYDKTRSAVETFIQYTRIPLEIAFKPLQPGEMEDFRTIAREVSPNDLLVVVSARKGTLSYSASQDNIPSRLGRLFRDMNVILIYPEQIEIEFREAGVQPDDLTLAPIQEQLANLHRLRRVFKRIFGGKK
jgi:hypothetical protein